jgi:hypothetical protein
MGWPSMLSFSFRGAGHIPGTGVDPSPELLVIAVGHQNEVQRFPFRLGNTLKEKVPRLVESHQAASIFSAARAFRNLMGFMIV